MLPVLRLLLLPVPYPELPEPEWEREEPYEVSYPVVPDDPWFMSEEPPERSFLSEPVPLLSLG